ncbi:MAG TPA: Maf family nucleotide pyrophosphatase [Sphingomonadales bacterium]
MTAVELPFRLASASPRRLDLLRQIGVTPAEVKPAEIDETPSRSEKPRALALRLAVEKARAVADERLATLAADTVVSAAARVLPKAEDEATARQCLEILSGRRHRVVTAVALVLPDGRLLQRVNETVVTFKRLEAQEIAHYLQSGEWHGKAGGYAIQGLAAAFVRHLNGSYSNVVGLPLYETANLLRGAGILTRAGAK